MLVFCPYCTNLLTISKVPAEDPAMEEDWGKSRFECRTCPYQKVLDKSYYETRTNKPKVVEDILGGKGSWDNVDKTQVQCPNEKCRNDTAYFYMLQIRSADEPMTSFYKCTKCAKEWRD